MFTSTSQGRRRPSDLGTSLVVNGQRVRFHTTDAPRTGRSTRSAQAHTDGPSHAERRKALATAEALDDYLSYRR